jgi:hypothetical protein
MLFLFRICSFTFQMGTWLVTVVEYIYKERYYTGTLGYNPECMNTI